MKLSIREQQIKASAADLTPLTRREQLLADETTQFQRVTAEEIALGGPNSDPDEGGDNTDEPTGT